MRKRITALITVSVIVCMALALLTCLFIPKYMRGIVEGALTAEYYDDKAPHEVIFIGDCELYENVSTVELYRKYGISSYIRGNSQQLVWQSYYLLEDALRYETPKVVVFNVLALEYNEPKSETYNRMTLDGMRWSPSKINAIKASMLPDENMVEYVFPFLRFHSRWQELKATDFKYMFRRDPVSINGYYLRADVRPMETFPDPKSLTDPEFGSNAMNYLQKMTDLCKSKGIDLILVKAPITYPYWYPEWDAQVTSFASENGLTYINYIDKMDEIGLDMTHDTYDGGQHLNVYGAEKFADYFGSYLSENYDLTDYRTVPEVAAIWAEKEDLYNRILEQQLAELEQYGELMNFGKNAIE
ncbi:hypothetical protein SAMN02910456_01975 [Ruminococcaceae bacterium YRB3002]|nr:hypothetical protein SAMN02910456_01975 [Ruminococcaceae bacterium YRB3002]